MRKEFTAAAMFLLLASSAAWATDKGGFIRLGTFGSATVFVGSGANAQRVGNAVLTYVHEVSSEFGFSGELLIACDGTWHSDRLRDLTVKGVAQTPQAYELNSREKGVDVPLTSLKFIDWQQSDLEYRGALRGQVPALCKGAAPEPKNVLIPISVYGEAGTTPGGSTAVTTGTLVRKGSEFDVWTRTTHFRSETTMVGDKPLILSGVEHKHRAPVGTHVMYRTTYDCTSQKMGQSQMISYDKDGVLRPIES